MRKFKPLKNDVAAILVADIHLSLNPPVARSAEEDWFIAQERQLSQLRELQHNSEMCPVIIAGDLFDRWDSKPELINFAMQKLPAKVYAVPGQHDLPYHSYEDIGKSAFWTLVQANRITLIEPGKPIEINQGRPIRLHGFPYGEEIVPLKDSHDLCLEVAVCHSYIWNQGCGHKDASDDQHYNSYLKLLKGYDLVVFGDNHIPFDVQNVGKQRRIWNCGAFFRRRSDEKEHWPRVGVLKNDGSVFCFPLNVAEDKFIREEEEVPQPSSDKMLKELKSFSKQGIDFLDYLKRIMKSPEVTKAARDFIVKVMEEAQK